MLVFAMMSGTGVLPSTPAAGRAPQTWPGKKITYFDATKAWSWQIKKAAAAWNAADIGIRLVPARSRSTADILIRICDLGPAAGSASLGYTPGGGGVCLHRRPAGQAGYFFGAYNKWYMARATAHELGHVLGLPHPGDPYNPQVCSIMAYDYALCGEVPPGMWRCRMVEPFDLRKATRLYGGGGTLQEAEHCYKWPIPPAVTGLQTDVLHQADDDVDGVALWWENPPLPAPVAAIHINRKEGACPSSMNDPSAEDVTRFEEERVAAAADEFAADQRRTTGGTYCYAVWSLEEAGRVGPEAATAWVDFSEPRVPEPGDELGSAITIQSTPFSHLVRTPNEFAAEDSDGDGFADYWDCDGYQSSLENTIWYRFSPNETRELTAKAFTNDHVAGIQVFRGDDLSPVGCSVDPVFLGRYYEGGWDRVTKTRFQVTAGATYFIRVSTEQPVTVYARAGWLEFSLR